MNSLTWAQNIEKRWDPMNPLLLVFFSEINYQFLIENILKKVLEKTGQKIAVPDKMTMLISMHNVFDNNKSSTTENLREDLTKINNTYFKYQASTLIEGLNDYKHYYKDASTMHVPMARSVDVNIKGTKILRNKFLVDQGPHLPSRTYANETSFRS